MTGTPENAARRLAELVDDPDVRRLFIRLVADVSGLHESVNLIPSGVDLRVEAFGQELCRAVPYRGLIHLRVGASVPWECRVRDEAGYLAAVDAVVSSFLELVSRQGRDGRSPASSSL